MPWGFVSKVIKSEKSNIPSLIKKVSDNLEENIQRFSNGFKGISGISIFFINSFLSLLFSDDFISIGREFFYIFILLILNSMIFLALSMVVYMIPALPIQNGKLEFKKIKDYNWIMKQQLKSTIKKYKIRWFFLASFFSLGFQLFLANIVYIFVGILYL